MKTGQILKCIRQDPLLTRYASGVYPSDQLPAVEKLPSCFIANVDPTNEPGRHWVAIYIGADGVGEFFDSYGRAPTGPFEKYLKRNCKKVVHNSARVQGPLSSSCGQFCIYYLCHRVRGWTMKNIVSDFCDNFSLNDISVVEYVNKHFDVNAKVYELDFIVSQLCKAE
jgi:hypothetical protein